MATNRISDWNGWWEVDGNPLSKVGVFQYSGKSINLPGLDPNQLYNVYRPAEELSCAECIESFKLLPWINDHPKVLLGASNIGGVAPESKGVEGVIGERVFFDELDDMLKGNIKVFSESHAQRIAAGKEELSAGYRCRYEASTGLYKGEAYQFVQRDIRGNHVASVDVGRMGPDVAVLDGFTFTVDAKEFKMATKKPNKISKLLASMLAFAMDAEEKMTDDAPEEAKSELATLQALLKQATPIMTQLAELNSVMTAPSMAVEADPATSTVDADEEAKKMQAAKDAEEAEAKKKDDDDKKGGAMDAAEIKKMIVKAIAELNPVKPAAAMDAKEMMREIGQRDALARQLSHFVGTFDASEMTHAEVAVYGAEKLGLKAAKGLELATLQGYLHNRPAPSAGKTAQGMDAADGKPNFVQRHLANEAA